MNPSHRIRRITWYLLRSYHNLPRHRAKLYMQTWDKPDHPKVDKKAYYNTLKRRIYRKKQSFIFSYH